MSEPDFDLKVAAVGWGMPRAFPVGAHDAVLTRLARYQQSQKVKWRHFASGWNAVAHRYRAATEASRRFGNYGEDSFESLYAKEEALVSFFVYALSTLESFFYAMYCIAGLSRHPEFPVRTRRNLSITAQGVRDKFRRAFPNHVLTRRMTSCLRATMYKGLADQRNALAHRGTPGRLIPLGEPSRLPKNPKSLAQHWRYTQSMAPAYTELPLTWLTQTLTELLEAADQFCADTGL